TERISAAGGERDRGQRAPGRKTSRATEHESPPLKSMAQRSVKARTGSPAPSRRPPIVPQSNAVPRRPDTLAVTQITGSPPLATARGGEPVYLGPQCAASAPQFLLPRGRRGG